MASTNPAHARIKKEFKEVQQDKSGLGADLVNGDVSHWKGYITGPQNTPYDGGFFVIDIVIPDQYPFVPPKMRFDTKVYHPNVSSANGAICLDILKDEWSPALTLRTALLSLQALLSCPNADDPQDAVVAKVFKSDRTLFDKTATQWTKQFALDPKKLKQAEEEKAAAELEGKVKTLTEMGFAERDVRAALQKANNNLDKAMNVLLGG